MQRSLKCPKCGGVKIWVIERFRVPSESAEGQPLSVVPHQEEMTRAFFAIGRVSPRGHFDVYACDGCGYSELYARGLDQLTPDPEHGVRLIDASEPQKGPFR